MAKTQAGLLSMGATGSIGGIMTFASWKGRPYVRRLVVPANPNSAAQRAIRAFMSWGSKEWAQLTAPEQATWNAAAVQQNYLPFNAFISRGQSNVVQDLGFQSEDPAPAAAAADEPTMPSATGGKGQSTIEWTDGIAADNFGVIIYGTLGAAVTPGPQTILGVVDMGLLKGIVLNLEAGTWHWKLKTFNKAGELSAATADFTSVVT